MIHPLEINGNRATTIRPIQSQKEGSTAMILVTGATGKNGTEILKRLSARRERIRAMVRKRNEMMALTLHSEPEFVEGDFDDTTSLRKALAGVQRAFLVTNSSERVEERQLRFVSLARE